MEDSQKTISNDVSSAARAGVSAARTAISVGKAAGKAAAGDVAGAAIELATGGTAQPHVGTGGGGSTSELPWRNKDKDKYKTTKKR